MGEIVVIRRVIIGLIVALLVLGIVIPLLLITAGGSHSTP